MFVDYPVLDSCKNLENSYGEICVKCNKCGRFNKEIDGKEYTIGIDLAKGEE